MKRLKQTRQFLLLALFGAFIFSCTEREMTIEELSVAQKEFDVSAELAINVAKNFSQDQAFLHYPDKNEFKSSFRSSKLKSKKEVKEILTFNDGNGFPALYVIQLQPEGFVIVSGSKKETPILAFSETGIFVQNPSLDNFQALNEWIKVRIKRIEELRNDPTIEVSEETVEQWVYSAPPIDDEVIVSGGMADEQKGPLLVTTWGQGEGYNDLVNDGNLNCSSYSNGNAPTGCTATATAQVMNYWGFPNSYNWGIMPAITGSNETSKLMRDIGDAVEMNYACDGSGASLLKAKNTLVNTFGYSGNTSYVNYNANTIITQLNAGWPVILEGFNSSNSSGHAWVCEGYKRNIYISIHNPGTVYEYETYTYSPLYLYMNWGWNGGSNAWYLYNDFTPGIRNYNYNNNMIINIHP